jgi:hypothetical protein
MVVIINKLSYEIPGIVKGQGRLGSDALAFEHLAPPFDLSITLRVKEPGTYMGHPAQPDKILEIPGNKLRTIVRDNPR